MTITIKNYPQHDLENNRVEGVSTEINKCNECDSDKEKKSRRDSRNDDDDSGDEKLHWA